jgi:hypothetical protein
VDGRVQIAARKGNLTISDDSGITTLAEGQQTSRDDSKSQSKNRGRNKDVAPAAATGPVSAVFDSPITIGIAGGLVLGGAIWVLSHSDDPLSPSNPNFSKP